MSQVVSTHCSVEIVAPTGRRWTFAQREAADLALLAVETHKDLAEAVGSFTLHFTAELDEEGRRWDQRIPRRSLVTIRMEGPGGGPMDGINPVVMLGLTDDHAMQESWQEAHPRRTVVVRGREISAVILDAMLWFHAALANDPRSGTLNTTFATTLDRGGPSLQAFALQYNQNVALSDEDPRITIKRILDVYIFEGGTALGAPPSSPIGSQRPVISLDLPDTPLSQILQTNHAAWTLFQPVTVPLPQIPAAVGSVWNLLHLYIDRAFQEFFTRVENGVCKIHFRGKPFLQTPVTSGTRFQSTAKAPTLITLVLDEQDLLAQQLQCQTSNVYNVFVVDPLGMSDQYKAPDFRYAILPYIIEDPKHPSFIGRYGLRIMQVQSMYLSPLATPGLARSKARIDNAPAPQPLTKPAPNAAGYAARANQIAAEQGIPPDQRPWFLALLEQESGWNPNAVHKNSDGSLDEGIAQFHRPYPNGVTLVNPYDPEEAMLAAAQYWNIIRRTPGIGDNPPLIAAAYNVGPSRVVNAQGQVPTAAVQHVNNVSSRVAQHQGVAGTAVAASTSAAIFSPAQPLAPNDFPEFIEAAKRWATILGAWYDMGGELFGGTLTIRGHPAWNVGHRLLTRDERGEWEAYIEGVNHRYDMRTGNYITSLRVTRGWYLSPAIAAQLWAEGQTNITETSGGPPKLQPAFGVETEDARVGFVSLATPPGAIP